MPSRQLHHRAAKKSWGLAMKISDKIDNRMVLPVVPPSDIKERM
jgi:hypothetical protein